MLPVVERVFEGYRAVLPSFRWSSSRFSSLYPLHPAIMEIAPFVRLYLPDFALLGFAAAAGSRILGRPADSLIAPDEVFDNVEKRLREIPALTESWATFDRINDEVVAEIPVKKRLQAKLILKGLLLFSLNDEGVTAAEIGASMLIYDERDPEAAVNEISAVLEAFAAEVGDAIRISKDHDGRSRYAIELSGRSDLKNAVLEAANSVSEENVRQTLRALMNERFSDCDFNSGDAEVDDAVICSVDWRGGRRLGRVLWSPTTETLAQARQAKRLEWEIRIAFDETAELREMPTADLPPAFWRPSELTPAEREAIACLWILQNDAAIRSEYIDRIAAAIQTQTRSAERVFRRAFLEDSIFTIDEFDYNLTDEARGADTLKQIGSIMLDSLFAARYSLHPVLERSLEMSDVSLLTADFFSGARTSQQDAQENARDFAMPLGLATLKGLYFEPLTREEILQTDFASLVLDAVKQNQGSASLDVVFARLAATPYGLVRESAYLVLGALAGQQQIDFVTTGGDRINHRSLDLDLVWNDLAAVADPELASYSTDRLAAWARLLTGDAALASTKDEAAITAALSKWLDEWNYRAVAQKFDALEEDEMTARIWRLSKIAFRPFVSIADSVAGTVSGATLTEDCLKNIADAFSDSEAEFERRSTEVQTVENFIEGASLRREALRYSSLSEYADNADVDDLRLRLTKAIEDSWSPHPTVSNDELATIWENFRRSYADLYAVRNGHYIRRDPRED